jgi:hypothetical protein
MSNKQTPSREYGNPLRSARFLTGIAALIVIVAAAGYLVGAHGNNTPKASSGITGLPPRTQPPSPSAAATPSPEATATACSSTRNIPGGADPWGGCWPGPGHAGVPAGTRLTAYHDSCKVSANNVIIDRRNIKCSLIVSGSNVTIKDSQIDGIVMNDGQGNLVIEDSTINGGDGHVETVGGSNITIVRSNLFGNQHEIYCGANCTVRDSWLHDNFNGKSQGWHQNSFLSTGGTGYNLQHNSVYCVGGCTSDIAFIPNGNVTGAVVNRNLFVASPDSAYCLYPSSTTSKPGIVSEMTITDNVFQRGANGKCATYGPVYGWDSPDSQASTDGYRNTWSGNRWADGSVLNP